MLVRVLYLFELHCTLFFLSSLYLEGGLILSGVDNASIESASIALLVGIRVIHYGPAPYGMPFVQGEGVRVGR